MNRSRRSLQACIVVALVAGLAARTEVVARPDLSGTWKLNGGQSDMPSEVGFDPNWQDTESKSGGRSGGGGGRSSGGGGGRGSGRSSGSSGGSSSTGAIAPRFESEEDSRKIRELRYAFARAASARQLLVTTQFAERGRGQIITRVYD